MYFPLPTLLLLIRIVSDTAILTQSRFILMDSIMMCFGLSALLAVLKFRKVSKAPFSPAWFIWLTAVATLTTAAFRYRVYCLPRLHCAVHEMVSQ